MDDDIRCPSCGNENLTLLNKVKYDKIYYLYRCDTCGEEILITIDINDIKIDE